MSDAWTGIQHAQMAERHRSAGSAGWESHVPSTGTDMLAAYVRTGASWSRATAPPAPSSSSLLAMTSGVPKLSNKSEQQDQLLVLKLATTWCSNSRP